MKLITLVVLTSAGIFASDARAADPKSDTAVITDYVVRHRHWRLSDFRIDRYGQQDGYVVYAIGYLPELKEPVVGGGESFAVYCDSAKHVVVKEMRFQ